jgi:hypothetical protein
MKVSRLPTVALGRTFTHAPEDVRRDLDTLHRELAIYTDHWIDELEDFRHVRIAFTPEERDDYGRRAWAYELFLRAGHPDFAASVPGIDADVAQDADSYSLTTAGGKVIQPYHCFAAFLGPPLERLTCSTTERQIVLDLHGREALLFTVRRTIETLTPTIRSFNSREKGLASWSITREDDVRDLLYVMLRPAIFDLMKEEPVPTRAGTHKFVDLCSKALGVLIEIKWISRRGRWKRIVEQIHVDIQTYVSHPACRDVVFVVVDAARDIPDPRNLEHELTGEQAIGDVRMNVRVIVCES